MKPSDPAFAVLINDLRATDRSAEVLFEFGICYASVEDDWSSLADFIVVLVQWMIRKVQLYRSRDWLIVPAVVLSTESSGSKVTVYYEYLVDGGKYGTWYNRYFVWSDSGRKYAEALPKGTTFQVRVKPNDSFVVVPIWA